MVQLSQFNLIRVGAAVPKVSIANPDFNVDKMIALAKQASVNFIKVLVFPELCVSAYSCEDLFFQSQLIKRCEHNLIKFLSETKGLDILLIIGMPIRTNNRLYNCAVATLRGEILGIYPKVYLPNYAGSSEKRWFSSANDTLLDSICILGKEIPFSKNILFTDTNSDFVLGIEICEDLWTVIPPSSIHSLNGANVIANLSASPHIASKEELRKDIVRMQSQKCHCAYMYSSASVYESTTDSICSGHSIIASLGKIFSEDKFTENNGETLIYTDIDLDEIQSARNRSSSFYSADFKRDYIRIPFFFLHNEADALAIKVESNPFLAGKSSSYLQEIIEIQSSALARRLSHISLKKCVVAVSGGLDSTLALLITAAAFDKTKISREGIVGISMPGFGTSKRTHSNADALMEYLSITSIEIPIINACTEHLKNIFHNGSMDVVYENAQARERTQIAMDYANKINAIVVGTGDLSEIALGFCTYNGDHMSMYSLNSSLPKTVIRALIQYFADVVYKGESISSILLDILNTPVSPELVPPDENGVTQKTEQFLGDYAVHDFILYHMLKNNFCSQKIKFLAEIAFKDRYDSNYICNCINTFYKRFFSQQFKRNCSPDGISALDISLSPRGGFKMSSDVDSGIWME